MIYICICIELLLAQTSSIEDHWQKLLLYVAHALHCAVALLKLQCWGGVTARHKASCIAVASNR